MSYFNKIITETGFTGKEVKGDVFNWITSGVEDTSTFIKIDKKLCAQFYWKKHKGKLVAVQFYKDKYTLHFLLKPMYKNFEI